MWYLPWSESIKKRACRYLLQRYLGNFLEEKLTLAQLSVDLYNGTGTVLGVSLDCEAINQLGDTQNWPLEIVDGHIKEITVTVPWCTILKDDSVVEINGLSLTVQPKVGVEPASSMLESMWSSMSSSMQLAAECLQEDTGPRETNPVEGIEMFAHAIDSILSRVKVKFVNAKLRIEHVPKNGHRGIAMEIHIKHVDYLDEAGSEPLPESTDPDKPKTYIVATYTNKKIKFDGVTFYIDEFPSKLRTMAPSLIMEKSSSASTQADKSYCNLAETPDSNYQSTLSDVFYETKSVISTIDADPIKEIIEERHIETTRVEIFEENMNPPDPILFAKLTGQQELSLKLKNSAEAEGPKVEVNILLGSFLIFITPRHLHTLLELVDALKQPDLEDTSNIPVRSTGMNVQCKPMNRADFQLIETQLLGNIEKQHSKPPGVYGWSGPSKDDSDTESDTFLPLTSQFNPMTESFTSSVSSITTSMSSSMNITSQPKIKRNKKVPHIGSDPTAETSHISMRIASFTCVLLHKDILVPTPFSTYYISRTSAANLQTISTEFFNRIETFSKFDDKKDMTTTNKALDTATDLDHLRLLTTEISLHGTDKVTTHGSQKMCEAAIKYLLVRECLFVRDKDSEDVKRQEFDVISFEDNEEDENASATAKSNVTFNFKQTSKYKLVSGDKKLVYPTIDIGLKCMPFYIDVDLTLMERMSATFFEGEKKPAPTAPPSQNQHNFSLQCSNLNVILRFPIADLRPSVNRNVRHVRDDYLVFKFCNAVVGMQQVPSVKPSPTTITVKSTILDLFYHENYLLPATHVAQSTMYEAVFEENILKGDPTFTNPLPMISLTFKSKASTKGPFDSLHEDLGFEPKPSNPMTTSIFMMDILRRNVPSPFSGKKMAHQSIGKHENDQDHEEEIIVPGSEDEMKDFTQYAVENSGIHLEFSLPMLSLQLESKQLYEIIYNRINSDLLLWEPKLNQSDTVSDVYSPINVSFGLCKGMGDDSDSESSSSAEEDNLYYSTYDNKLKKGIGNIRPIQETEESEMHNFCLTLKINKGLLTIYAPVRDSNKRVVPGQMGELVLEANKFSMCHVSGLNGRSKTAQLCLRAGQATLYHEPVLTIPSEKPNLRCYGTTLPLHLKGTIYPSGKGVTIKEHLKSKDMFTMALKTEPDADTPSLKTICIALGIEQASLRHRGDSGAAWLSQLLDVLDVLDYPVPGYVPTPVLSQLHVHVWDCAIDYRPLYLPIRAVLTLGSFSVSSNIIPETNTSYLRFLAQECNLFLLKLPENKLIVTIPQNDDKLPDLKKDYVCVIDVGLFELSIRTEDKANTNNAENEQPQVDLTASSNMINLNTCWDSASALFRLVTYVASDGDSEPPTERSRQTSICSDQEEPLVGLDRPMVEEIRELSETEIQQVNDLMAEAMKESPDNTMGDDVLNTSTDKQGVEVFFFPDESNMKQYQSSEFMDSDIYNPYVSLPVCPTGSSLGELSEDTHHVKPTNTQVARDLGDPTSSSESSPKKYDRTRLISSGDENTTDDEYCIVDENDSHDSELDEPVVRWMNGPLELIENHFTIPAARTDVLAAPKNFPTPVFRYTLCEMNLTWSIYGGNDFKSSPPAKKTVSIDESVKQGPSGTSKRSKEYELYETRTYREGGVGWKAGADRVRTSPACPASPAGAASRGGPASPACPTSCASPASCACPTRRDTKTCVKLCLTKVKFVHEVYPTGAEQASRQTLAVSKIEVLDRLACSGINKILSQYKDKDEPESKNAYMLIVKAAHLRVEPTRSAQECCLKVSILPLRFNLDQDTVAFLVSYFSKLGSDEIGEEETKSVSGTPAEGVSRQTTPTHRPPVMTVGSRLRDPPPTPTSLGDADCLSLNEHMMREEEPLMETYEAERLVSENLIQLEEDFQRLASGQERPAARLPDSEPVDDAPIYFRRVVFTPEVPIRLDYVGKRVDLSAGPITGLLMGLGQLNCSELILKRLDYKLGLLGLEKLVQWALHEWLSDIKRNQLPGLLSGIGPMHSLLQLITGIRDLVWLPVEQFRRDGRLVHGLRRGAASFTARTAVAALDITARILHLVQATAETAFDMLTPAPPRALAAARRRRRAPPRAPADIREGVASAYNTVREGLSETAANISEAARGGRSAGVLRQLPGAAVTPLALAAAGAADLLGGVRAHLAPHLHRDHADKWRHQQDETN